METAEKLITENLDVWTSAVKATSSAGRGASKKQELYGIQKLRGLILELAIRGLLAPQDSNDEPVADALSRITAERNRLIADGAIRSQKPSEIPSNETPFELPKGWQWVRLCEVAYPQAGFAFKSKNFNESELGLPLVRIRDVGQPFSGTFYDGEYREEFVIKEGDYLISMDGNFRVAPWDHGKALLNQRVSRLIFFGNEHSEKFCAISLQLRLSELQGVKAYTTVDHLSGKQISNTIIGFPPLAEQHRIVAKVDELMELCDQLEQEQASSLEAHDTLVATLLDALTTSTASPEAFAEAWQRIQSNFDTLFTTESSIDQLKQTILQLAVMGKLVEQDPGDEPAETLLRRFTSEKISLSSNKKTKKSTQPAETLELFTLPESWEWCKIWDVSQLITSGSRDWAKYYSDSGPIFVTMGNLSHGDYRLRMDTVRHVQPPSSAEGARTKLQEGDLLISITGDVGNLGLIPKGFGEAYINQHTCLLRIVPECRNRYFAELLRSPWSKYQFDAPQRGIKNSFRLPDVGEMLIPVPPLAEQHRIVAKVDELMAICDQFKANLAKAQETQLNLADSFVEQAVG